MFIPEDDYLWFTQEVTDVKRMLTSLVQRLWAVN